MACLYLFPNDHSHSPSGNRACPEPALAARFHDHSSRWILPHGRGDRVCPADFSRYHDDPEMGRLAEGSRSIGTKGGRVLIPTAIGLNPNNGSLGDLKTSALTKQRKPRSCPRTLRQPVRDCRKPKHLAQSRWQKPSPILNDIGLKAALPERRTKVRVPLQELRP